jgi:hypothetical protein
MNEPNATFTSPLLAPPPTGDETAPAASPPSAAPKAAPAATMPLLWVWLLLFGFVGTQLGWTPRPFFGSPGLPFQVFRPLEGNFYSHLGQLLIALLR